MDEKILENKKEIEIDLQRVFRALLHRAWIIGLVAVVCAVLTFVGTFLFVTPQYRSSVMFYVNNSSLDLGDITSSITSSDISASRGLVKTYIIILNTRETLNDVIDYAEVDRTYSQVKGMIQAESVESTEIFRVIVESPDPVEADKIANAIAYVLPKRIDSIIDGTSAKVVDPSIVAAKPSSPNYTTNTILGFLLGLLATAAVVVVLEVVDITIRTEEDITTTCALPVLAAVPDMEGHSHKSGYYYGYKKSSAYARAATTGPKTVLLGRGISFAASEAYKLLRTKLQFSFTDEGNCRVVGVSSSMTGEGKSLTSVNLALSMSQLGKRVLLIDCDMRRPSIADKLPIVKDPGLSEYLSGQAKGDNLIQFCGLEDDENAFHVISAGRIPPNPIELLSSKKMEKVLEKLRQSYDYIVLDLPPVGEVSDALAVAKYTDGILLVVRHNYCNRLALNATIRQFEFVESRILGIVSNCADEETAAYNKKYYKKYGRKYYKRYYGNYVSDKK